MLMMMRADETTPSTDGCSAEELLACITADDYDACIAECAGEEPEEPADPEEVKAGTLKVTMTSEKGGDIPNGITSLPVVTYTLKATDEDIDITSLVLEQKGYGTDNAITAVALFINGQRVSKLPKDLNIGKKTTINLSNAYTVKAGKSVDIEVRVTVGAAANEQFSINLVEVNSSAEKVNMPSNAESNTFKIVATPTVKINATVSPLTAIKAGTKNAELFEVKLSGNTGDVELNSITFYGDDRDLADYLKDLKLVIDGETVANAEMDGKYLTFNLDKAYLIEKNRPATFTVKGDVIGGAGKSFIFKIETVMDLLATAKEYNAPANVTTAGTANLDITAGRVVIDRTNPTNTTFTKNRKNIYLGSLTINNNAGNDITLTGFNLQLTKKNGSGMTDYIDSVKVRYGSQTAGLTDLTIAASGADLKITSTDEQAIGSKLTIYVYADLKDDVEVSSNKFQMSLTNIGIEENENNKAVTDVSMPASWVLMEGAASALNISNVNVPAKSYTAGSDDVKVVSFKIRTDDIAGLKVKKMRFVATNKEGSTGVDNHTIRGAYVTVGDTNYDVSVQNGYIDMSNVFTLDKETIETVSLYVNLASNPTVRKFQYALTGIEAEDTSADRNVLIDNNITSVVGGIVTVASKGTLTISMENTENNKNAKSILAGTTGNIADLSIQAKYEDLNAKTLTLTFDKTLPGNVSNVKFYYNGNVVAENPEINGDTVTFKNMNLTLAEGTKPATIEIVTDSVEDCTYTTSITLSKVQFSNILGKDSGEEPDGTAAYPTTLAKKFSIVPVIITPTIISKSDTQTKLNIFVDRGDNVCEDNTPIKTYLASATGSLSNNGGLMYVDALNGSDKLFRLNASDGTWDSFNTIDKYLLQAGDNEITINYVVSGSIQNPAYAVDLKELWYYMTGATLAGNYPTGLLDPVVANFAILNLVTK